LNPIPDDNVASFDPSKNKYLNTYLENSGNTDYIKYVLKAFCLIDHK
jgi:hypothetical protein